MKKQIISILILSLLVISSCNTYNQPDSPIIDYKNQTAQQKDNLPSAGGIITASFVVLPPENNNTK